MPRLLTLGPLLLLSLASCRSARVRNADLVAERTAQLAPLSRWTPSWCRVDARLSAPAMSRYRQIFPKDIDEVTATGLPFTWKATSASCEVVALNRSPLAANFQSVLETALCLLVQTHYVHSPFDALEPVAVESRGKTTFLRTGEEKDLGLYLDPTAVAIETRTKSRGVLDARFERAREGYRPERLRQTANKTIIEVDQLEYEGRLLKSFVINVGEEHARPFATVDFNECRSY